MSGPTVNVTGPLISQYLTDNPTGPISLRLNAYTSGPVFAVNYHLDYTAALESYIDTNYLKSGDFDTLATDAVSGAVALVDFTTPAETAVATAAGAYDYSTVASGAVDTAATAYDYSTLASGAVSTAAGLYDYATPAGSAVATAAGAFDYATPAGSAVSTAAGAFDYATPAGSAVATAAGAFDYATPAGSAVSTAAGAFDYATPAGSAVATAAGAFDYATPAGSAVSTAAGAFDYATPASSAVATAAGAYDYSTAASGAVDTAANAYDYSTLASGAVDTAVSGAIAPAGSLYTYVHDTIYPDVNSSVLGPIYDRLRVIAGFMEVISTSSNLVNGFSAPYNWSTLMNLGPVPTNTASGTLAFPVLQASNDVNLPNGFRVGVVLSNAYATNDSLNMYNFYDATKDFWFYIYTATGTLLTHNTDYILEGDADNFATIASSASQNLGVFTTFPVAGLYSLVIRVDAYNGPIVLAQKLYSDAASLQFTPY